MVSQHWIHLSCVSGAIWCNVTSAFLRLHSYLQNTVSGLTGMALSENTHTHTLTHLLSLSSSLSLTHTHTHTYTVTNAVWFDLDSFSNCVNIKYIKKEKITANSQSWKQEFVISLRSAYLLIRTRLLQVQWNGPLKEWEKTVSVSSECRMPLCDFHVTWGKVRIGYYCWSFMTQATPLPLNTITTTGNASFTHTLPCKLQDKMKRGRQTVTERKGECLRH